MTLTRAIEIAVENGFRVRGEKPVWSDMYATFEIYDMVGNIVDLNTSEFLIDPDFWRCLGKGMGWGQKIYATVNGEEWGRRVCLHCGVDCDYQPSIESGCNHAHYPEACRVCESKRKKPIEYQQEMIRGMWEGKTPESFFDKLGQPNK